MTAMLRGIRGATTVEADDAGEIRLRTQELVREMLSRNDVKADDLVSIIFTATEDLNAAFPATAARELGLDDVPLLGGREIAVPGALARCVRVLIHCYSERSRAEIRHVYLEGARVLRADLAE
ncbi:MAG TPA: chorismate mutase [Acidimicrobiales bacterium]|nr:chorismate mutase [Acidimicrobiales bacterium]